MDELFTTKKKVICANKINIVNFDFIWKLRFLIWHVPASAHINIEYEENINVGCRQKNKRRSNTVQKAQLFKILAPVERACQIHTTSPFTGSVKTFFSTCFSVN